jgi:hypothetical protein
VTEQEITEVTEKFPHLRSLCLLPYCSFLSSSTSFSPLLLDLLAFENENEEEGRGRH